MHSARRLPRFLACLFLSLFLPLVTLHDAAAQTAEPVVLGPGDVLELRFQGRDSLNGDYVIGVDGDLFFPGIGGVEAKGRTVAQVVDDLDSLMRQTFGLNTRTFALSIAEFRPIYVGGRVRQPGSYPFRPGLRVAHAVAMAGGTRGLRSEEPIVALETGREFARLRVDEDQLANALLRRNRLLAKLGMDRGEAESDAAQVSDLVGAQDASLRTAMQGALDDFQTQVDDIQRTVLNRRAETAAGEADALQSQLDALRELLDISARELEILEDPSERGIVPRSRILELQRLVAATNGEISATVARRYSAESNQRAFEGDSRLIDASRRLQHLLELTIVDAEISALRRSISATRSTLDDIGGLPSADGEGCGIEVWRTENGRLDVLTADLKFAIQPGDFVRLVEKLSDGTCDRQTK